VPKADQFCSQIAETAPESLREAWSASDEAFSMLVLLELLHPRREDATCVALARALAFHRHLQRAVERQALRGVTFQGRRRRIAQSALATRL